MRKIIKTLLVVLVLCLVLTAFASCDKMFTKPTEKTEPVHTHTFGDASCTEPAKCECGEPQGEALGHDYLEGVCSRCGAYDPDYLPPHDHNYVDGKCDICGEYDPDYVPPHKHNFVDGKCECGEEDPNYVPPHEHNFVDGKCECGEEDPNYVPPHEHSWSDATCTEPKKCECGETDGDPLGHTMVYATTHPTADAKGSTVATCSVCGEVVKYDEVGVMGAGTYLLNASDLDGIAQYTLIDGEVKVVAGVFDCHLSYKYRTDAGQKKTFPDDYYGEYRMNFGGKTEIAKEEHPDRIKNGIVFTTTGETTVTVWWVEGGDDHRQVGLYNLAGEIVVQSDNQTAEKNQACIDTFTVPAGTYVLGNVINTNYIFKVEVVVAEAHTHVLNDVEGKAATCTEDGYTAYKACECGYTEGKEVLAATGHSYEAVATAPTCTEAGYTTHTCGCGDSYVDGEVEALGHDIVDDAAKAPTCTETGLTAGEHCSRCDDATVAQTVVDALGHDLVDVEGKDATCAVAGYTAYKDCSRCDHVEGKEVIDATGAHVDATEDFKCDVCSTKMLPADGTTLTIEQALTIAKLAGTSYTTQKYYITGTIKNVYNTKYGNMYIVDGEGNELCIYGLYSADGETRYDAMDYKPVAGDEITVYTVLGMYNTTCQGESAWLDEVVAHEHDYVSVVTDATCLKDGYTTHTCSICGDEYVGSEVEALGHTTDNGTCERCGTVVGGEVNTDPVTVSKTVADLITEYGWTNSTTKQSFDLDNVVSVKINGGNNTGKAYEGDHIRIYATDTPAGTITITVPEGYELVSIKISTKTGTYAFLYVDGTTTDISNVSTTVSGNSVVLNSVKNGSNGKQVRVTGIEVTYKPIAE